MAFVDQGSGDQGPGFGIYVHWPFCLAKCPYCDFNSHVRAGVDHARWRDALLAELDHYAALTPGRTVTSIFFGGGTPSLMEPATVAAVIERIGRHWTLTPGLEITLEANPTSVEAGRFAGFRAAGVNRVSLGIQALDDASLKFLGRAHSASEALGAIGLAARHFDRFSFDLISVYQLTIEEGTQFHTLHSRGAFATPDDELAGDLYEATQALLEEAGLPAYEISNHARPGEESRHNLTYWRYGDYVGIGPGAHGRLTLDGAKYATRAHRAPEAWLDLVARNGHGGHASEEVAPSERLVELLMMGLRLREGVSLAHLHQETGLNADQALDPAGLRRMVEGGFVELTPTRLRATAAGRQRLNGLLAQLLPA
jgi:coproporphyrinogen III oxidase-like Fe-S oxidoreductase